ncbi:MAG: hypothetical protein QW650_00505 [Thermofilum sp.]
MGRGLWSELLAELVLELEGFEVVKRQEKILRGGEEVGEVDIVARKGNDLFAVEVKSGKISVGDVRQAYTNSVLLGFKPLLIARGFSDKAAEELAKELGVEVFLLPEYFHFVSMEELTAAIEQAVVRVLDQLVPAQVEALSSEDILVLEALALSSDFSEAARRANFSEADLGKRLDEMRRRGVITRVTGFAALRLQAKLILLARRALKPT